MNMIHFYVFYIRIYHFKSLKIVLYSNLTYSGPMGMGSNPNEFIQDETLAHLTVKELNKRVSNLSRDEVVALKQRRRTLKNRG